MTLISTKPVKQCAGCELNLRKSCAVFEHPVLQWHKHRCEGYNNPVIIERYRRKQNPQGASKRRQRRIERAKAAHTVGHADGVKRLGR